MITGDIYTRYGGGTSAPGIGGVNECIEGLEVLRTQVIPNALKTAMEKYLRLIAGRIAARNSAPYSPEGAAKNLMMRSGAGMASVIESVKVEADGIDEIIGRIGGIWYLNTQEDGATITAKRSQYLTIPLPAALDAQGVPLKKRARDWENTFVKKSKNGNLIIFQKNGSGITPLYLLRKSVTIPKRLGMKTELETYLNLFYSMIEAEVNKEFAA